MTTIVRSQPRTVIVRKPPVGNTGAKGDPGSPGEGYANRALMAARLAPALLDDVYLAEAGREGKFVVEAAAAHTAAIAADTIQAIFVVSTADATKVYVRKSGAIRLTPEPFGAVRYDPTNEVDATVGLQAFFDHASDQGNARKFIYDWSGEWMTSDTIYACYWDGDEPNVERRFIMGTLRVAPKAGLPGGVALPYALEIAGYRMRWDGVCGIHPTGTAQYGNAYADRRYKRGVRLRAVSAGTFGDFRVDDPIRDAVHITSVEGSGIGFTVRAGTAHETIFPNANNIFARFGNIYSRTFGSSDRLLAAYGAATMAASARVQGEPGGAIFTSGETFSPGGGANSFFQRTKVTVPSTADLQIYDLIWCRVELTPAIYGTIACNNGASTITWTAGDPTNLDGAGHGLQVGDVYPAFDGGADAGKVFRIVSFGGTSNRTITVTPAPTTLAATASTTYVQNGPKQWHWVSNVVDATHFTVFPWIADRINSPLHIVHGAACMSEGIDGANVTIAGVTGLIGGIALWTTGTFAPKYETVLAENCSVGILLSAPINNVHNGLSIDHGHMEGVDAHILSGSINPTGRIAMESAFTLANCFGCGPRVATNDQFQFPFRLGDLKISTPDGTLYQTPDQNSDEGSNYDFYGISNAPKSREVYAHADTVTLAVTFDRDVARLFPKHHWAAVIWTDSDGSPPDGTLTLNMDASLAALGWAFAGAASGTSYAITAPTTSVKLALQFLPAAKKVAVTRFNGA